MNSTQSGVSSNQFATSFIDVAISLASTTIRILFSGIRCIPFRKKEFYVWLFVVLTLLYFVTAFKWDLKVLAFVLPDWISKTLVPFLRRISLEKHYAFLCSYFAFWFIFGLGIGPFITWRRLQRAIDCLNLKNGIGGEPKLIRVKDDGLYRQRITIFSEGIGIDRYEAKKADLEASLGSVIESMRNTNNPKFVEILLAKRRIPKACHYKDLISEVKKPYSIVIGESIGGIVIKNIRELPHLLIAGTTGGGKSVFFKQTILCLLTTSQRIQAYLLDLKGGVEMKEFADLPNVVVAKDEKSAVHVLRRIKIEMDNRFTYLEKNGYKRIDPERDKMDLIVVGVDEASVLYTKSNGNTTEAALVSEARYLTDNLAKLARAAGIHLILATQKVSKETIDTRIQENIGGRVCFRMNTLQGSITVLGNKAANELPDHPGRAIWATGSQFVEVQAPLISDEEIIKDCELIRYEYETGKRVNFQPLMTYQDDAKTKEAKPKLFSKAA